MRGFDEQPTHLFSYISMEQRVPATHPLRSIRQMTDRVLATLSPQFTKMYAPIGRPSIPPEKLLRALLLQVLYTVRSERLLMEQLEYNLLFRWFVGLDIALLNRAPTPTDAQLRDAMSGVLCRCFTHQRMIRAVQRYAREKAR
jgi:transposase